MAEKLGPVLKRLREVRGWSAREAAERTEGSISHSYLVQLEQGVHPKTGKEIAPSPGVLRALAGLYDVSFEYLMELAGYMEGGAADDLERDWPEGVQVLRRASKELDPETKRQMIRTMKSFLESDNKKG